MSIRKIVSIVALVALAAVFMRTSASASVVASGPIFQVMNTSETLPDGVWFRNSPHIDDTDRVTGHGVYAGNFVQLECYAFGDAVGIYNNRLWYYVTNITRPSVPVTGAPNAGYLNAHYINDDQTANQVDAGVSACNASTPTPTPTPNSPPTIQSTPTTPAPPSMPSPSPTVAPTPTLPEGASAFFIPPQSRFDAWFHPWPNSTANINDPSSTWAPGHCQYGGGVTNPYNGYWVSILGGWSLGRLGPIYYLMHATSEQASHIHSILLIDPGRAKEMGEACDAKLPMTPSYYLANWLSLNQHNHLMILAADATGADDGDGLTYYYLTAIQQEGLLNQVTICWDDKLDHEAAYQRYAANSVTSLISHPSNDCPANY
ncbi:MAG TPA: hypothetical protein VFV38_31720 [Ktedonobacteraceae bacterium]|nr:hypothetical protein [Ktedonobacteraceae bacterium]